MKGVVFTEFLDMVESRFSLQTLAGVVDDPRLPSGGAYTSVGTYDHAEMLVLIENLSRTTGIPAPDLVYAYGQYLFGRLAALYPAQVKDSPDALSLLENLEGTIHPEVQKLYPEAELPRFECRRREDGLEMVYRSTRPFADLAMGLIQGCAEYYGERFSVRRNDLEDGATRFTILREGRVDRHLD